MNVGATVGGFVVDSGVGIGSEPSQLKLVGWSDVFALDMECLRL